MDKIRSTIKHIVLPIYWAIQFFLLIKPNKNSSNDFLFYFEGIDKIVHIFIFFLLGLLFKISFPKTSKIAYFTLFISYGLLTEILQKTMKLGRSFEWYDLIADTIGLLIAYIFYKKQIHQYFI